jgi:hypothetical protein
LFAFADTILPHGRNKKAVEIEDDQTPDDRKTNCPQPVVEYGMNNPEYLEYSDGNFFNKCWCAPAHHHKKFLLLGFRFSPKES